jgi:hypothetical protein
MAEGRHQWKKEIPGSSLGVGAGLTPPFLNVKAQNEDAGFMVRTLSLRHRTSTEIIAWLSVRSSRLENVWIAGGPCDHEEAYMPVTRIRYLRLLHEV